MKRLTAVTIALILVLSMSCAQAEAADASFSDLLGVVSDGTYENAVIGFGFKGEGWEFMSEYEIAANMQLTEALLGEKAKQYLDSGSQMQVMMASAPDGITNINTVLNYMGGNAAIISQFGLETVLQMGKSTFVSTIESTGMKIDSVDVVTYLVDGRELAAYKSQFSMFGMAMTSIGLYFISGEYMAIITVTALNAEAAEAVMNGIYWL